jgi:RimJ/RimL family protein N-acetyltransferase
METDWSYGCKRALRGGAVVIIRSIRPDDRERLARHFELLSADSSYRRFFGLRHAIGPHEIDRLTTIDYPNHIALVATIGEGRDERIIGDARFVPTHHPKEAELAMSVLDEWQGRGAGSLLVRALVECAQEAGIERLTTDVMASNSPAIRMLVRSGFMSVSRSDGICSFARSLIDDPPESRPQRFLFAA